MNPLGTDFPRYLTVPDTLSVSFEGFGSAAFEILNALKEAPHIDTYRALKEEIDAEVKQPFKRFRDDLVVNWVLPNRLPFETERNVFSRLLKNDFGAGGCHHHLWLSFYRMGLRRLSDLQLAHTIRERGFSTSLFIGENAPALFREVKKQILLNPDAFIDCVNPLLEKGDWFFCIRPHKAGSGQYIEWTERLVSIPDEIERSKGIWWRIFYPKESILGEGKQLVDLSLQAVQVLWPLYLFFLNEPKGQV